MSTTLSAESRADVPTVGPRRWTIDDYFRMEDAGLFRDQRVELIEGEVYLLSPRRWEHAATLDRVAEMLKAAFGPGVWVRTQLPIRIGGDSMPEPDVSVVAGSRDDHRDHPETALLVAEVSVSTLPYDRRKASVYASAGIPEYWIVDPTRGTVEVRRDPGLLPDGRAGYRTTLSFGRGETVAPTLRPDAPIEVDRLTG